MSPFKKLGIGTTLVDALKQQGIEAPTPVQKETIALIKEGKDVIAEAQTGTGKTLAFLLPMFENIDPNISQTQGLIVTPTRELALQITEEAKKLNNYKQLNILAVYGGQDIRAQLHKLKNSVHLIIATPGRIIDHISRGTIDLDHLKTLVLDEADQMLHIGFKNEMNFIIKQTPKARQTLCFSATINSEVKKLAYKNMIDPTEIKIKKKSVTLENIDQYLIETTDRHKYRDLNRIIDDENPFMAIIFCRTKRRVDKLEEQMSVDGYNVKKLHGGLSQAHREKVMKSFRDIKIQYLIATDVASRGLDISGVTHVYNYDMPESAEIYIHRIGRTGRIGNKGITYLFTTQKNEDVLMEIQNHIKMKIPAKSLRDIVPESRNFLFKGDELFYADGTKKSKSNDSDNKKSHKSKPRRSKSGNKPKSSGPNKKHGKKVSASAKNKRTKKSY